MRYLHSFTVGFAAGALDALGWLKARNTLSNAPWLNHGGKMDGFDAFYSMTRGN